MFKYKNDKGIMCIVDTSANKEYRLSMPHEVVEVVAILNAAQQSVEPTECTECGCRLPDHFANCERQPV